MRVIVIDAEKFEIREEEWTSAEFLDRCRAAIGCGSLDVVRYANDMDIWVDDEGLLRPHRRYLYFEGSERFPPGVQLAGSVVITGGADKEGDTLGARMSIDALSQRVVFLVYPEKRRPVEPRMEFIVIPRGGE